VKASASSRLHGIATKIVLTATLIVLSACGGSSDEPEKVWVVGVFFVRGPTPSAYRFPEQGAFAMLRYKIPIYDSTCALTPDPNGPTSQFIYRFLISAVDVPLVLSGGFFQERKVFEGKKIITEVDDCSQFFSTPPPPV
jgi:hypothetical protein